MRDEEHQDYDERSSGGGLPFGKILLMIIGFIFIPAMIVGWGVYYLLFRKMNLRIHVSGLVLTLLFIATYSVMNIVGVVNSLNLIKVIIDAPNSSFGVIGVYLSICILLGYIISFGAITIRTWQLHNDPELRQIKGWAYHFTYAMTPYAKWRRNKVMKSLEIGNEYDYDKSPMGILEESVRTRELEDYHTHPDPDIIYRYYNEAKTHSIITGGTGSGKALHIDTIVPTNNGMKTVGTVNIGDILYDEQGLETKVLAKFQPRTPDHYEIIFKNGERVKACGDHLWNIGNVDERNTQDTRSLFNLIKDEDIHIEHLINGDTITHSIVNIIEIEDNVDDYYCFTVDSPSSLFLITESMIPTHNTVSMLELINNDIKTGKPVVMVDLKKSPDVIYFMSKWAQDNDREFYHFTSGKPGEYKNPYLSNQSTYDPLSTGSATSKADMVLNLRTWDTASEVFKQRTQDILQSMFYLLERTPRNKVPGVDWDSGGLAQIISALDVNNLREMIEVMNADAVEDTLSASDRRRLTILINFYNELSGKSNSGLKEQVNELLSICRTLIVSSYGDWLIKGEDPKQHIDLLQASLTENGPVILFSFSPQEEAEFARYMGNIVMSDLNRVSAEKGKRGDKTMFGVYIDEFQILDPSTITDLLEKSRSSGFFVTLSIQSFEQIVSSANANGEAAVQSIIDTCNNFLFHAGASYDSAERMSKILGKVDKYVYRTSSKMSSGGLNLNLFTRKRALVSKDIENVYLIPPEEFQELQSPRIENNFKSTAYIVNKTTSDSRYNKRGGAIGRKIHAVVDSEITDGVPDDFLQAIYIPSFEEVVDTKQYNEIDEDYDGGWGFDDIELDEIIEDEVVEVEPKELFDMGELEIEVKETKPTSIPIQKKKLTSFQTLRNTTPQTKTQEVKEIKELPKAPQKETKGLPKLPKLD